MRTDAETRLRAGLADYARAMRVDRPPLEAVLHLGQRPPRRHMRSPLANGRVAGPDLALPWSAQRAVVAVAAVMVVVAGTVAVLSRLDGATTAPVVTQPDDLPPSVWPLGEPVPADTLATPESAADTYLTHVAGLGPDWQRSEVEYEGDDAATVSYSYSLPDATAGALTLFVYLVRVDDLWAVTGAETEDGLSITGAAIVGDVARVQVVPDNGSELWSGRSEPLRAELIAADGAVIATAEARLSAGAWRLELGIDAGQVPAAVMVEGLIDEDGDPASPGEVAVHASSVVLPAEAAHHPAADLFPSAMPPGSFYDSWVYTATRRGADELADWKTAITGYIGTVVDTNAGPPSPTFRAVTIRPDGLEVTGRYVAADGGAGAFHMARLEPDGPWFLLSLKDNAIEVRDVTYTDTAAEVTLVVSQDSTLGVGGFRRDPVPAGEPWMRAGQEVVYEVPFGRHARNDSVATLHLVLDGLDDGSILRFHDAWSR
jgi:hypothetical protein